MSEHLSDNSTQQYGGFNRSRYVLWILGLGALGAIGVATPFVLKTEAGIVLAMSIGLLIVSSLGSFYPLVKRFHNQLASGWWALGSLVPILNIYVGIRALAYPPGYSQHKTFDRPAKIVFALFSGLLAIVLIGGVLGEFDDKPASKDIAQIARDNKSSNQLPNDRARNDGTFSTVSETSKQFTADHSHAVDQAGLKISAQRTSHCDAKVDAVMQQTRAIYAQCALPELHDLKECAPPKDYVAAPVGEFDAITVLDMSGSMAGRVSGMTKYNIAKEMLGEVLEFAAPTASLGLMVYGHHGDNTESGKSASCVAGELLAPTGSTPLDILTVVERLQPTGWTPIASSLSALRARVEQNPQQAMRVTMISDGLETCDGDPVEQARLLKEAGADVSVNVIGFEVGNDEVKQLRAIAKAGGGVFFDAKGRQGLREAALAEVRTRNAKVVHRMCSSAELAKFKIYSQGSAAQYRSCVSNTATKEWAAAREVASMWLTEQLNEHSTDTRCSKQLQAASKERYDEAKQHANKVYEEVKTQIAELAQSKAG